MERLRVPGRRSLHPADPHQRPEQLVVEPVLVPLAREDAREQSTFSSHELLVRRARRRWVAQVAVVLGDLVLEDQVVAERVPGQLAEEPVVLVQVVARVGEDEIGLDRAFSSSKTP